MLVVDFLIHPRFESAKEHRVRTTIESKIRRNAINSSSHLNGARRKQEEEMERRRRMRKKRKRRREWP